MSNFLDQQYEPLEIVGRGSFGIVRKVRRMSDGKILARKEVNFHRMNEREGMLITTELNILKHLKHKHIVRFHNMHIDHKAGIIYIFMEYCGGGDLLTFIKKAAKNRRLISEDTIWYYLMEILLALEYCHHPGHGTVTGSGGEGRNGPPILHRDLKPANVLLDESGSVKLCDFGLSKALEESNLTKTHVGTPYYMSPEIIQGKAYGLKSDIWALGCMIYELCAHKPPFHEAKMRSELCELIQNGRIQPLPKGYSQDLLDVIKSMLRLNPEKRPSVAQLLKHERFNPVYSKIYMLQKMLSKMEVELPMREQTHQEEIQIILSHLRQAQDQVKSLQVHVQQQYMEQCRLQLQVQSILERLNSVLPQRIGGESFAMSGIILTETGYELHLPT